jgi:rubrerythrin
MGKKIFQDKGGNIHFGLNAPIGFSEATKDDAAKALANLGERKAWRCNVCNDLELSLVPPKECPTCHVKNAYAEIDPDEFRKLIEIL